jgi:hypothetical protein
MQTKFEVFTTYSFEATAVTGWSGVNNVVRFLISMDRVSFTCCACRNVHPRFAAEADAEAIVASSNKRAR